MDTATASAAGGSCGSAWAPTSFGLAGATGSNTSRPVTGEQHSLVQQVQWRRLWPQPRASSPLKPAVVNQGWGRYRFMNFLTRFGNLGLRFALAATYERET